jgi:ankyrin repeat protein
MLGVKLLVWLSAFPRAQHFRYLTFRDGPNLLVRHPISNAAKYGYTAVVAKFLDHVVDVNHQSRFHRSPLALEAGGGHFDTVKMLLIRGACLLSVVLDGRRPITYSARERHNDIADYLLDEFWSRYPRLHLTTEADIQIMLRHGGKRLLFNEGAEINFQFTMESRTPLYDAVKSPCQYNSAFARAWSRPRCSRIIQQI